MGRLNAEKDALRCMAAGLRQDAAMKWPQADKCLAGYAGALNARFSPQAVAGYWPIKTELSVLPLMTGLCANSRVRLALPLTGPPGTALAFHQWHPGEALDSGPYGTCQPFAKSPRLDPDVILLPLLAFDSTGARLGYGGGFYDRSLASFRRTGHNITAIGIGYDEQQVAQVPVGRYDQRLDAVLTPSGLVIFEKRVGAGR